MANRYLLVFERKKINLSDLFIESIDNQQIWLLGSDEGDKLLS